MKQKLPFLLAIVALCTCLLFATDSIFWTCRYILGVLREMNENIYTSGTLEYKLTSTNAWLIATYSIKSVLFLLSSVLISFHIYFSTRKDQDEKDLEKELKKQ